MRLVLLGGGGHASDILGVIEANNQFQKIEDVNIDVIGILSDTEVDTKRFSHRGVEHIGVISDLYKLDVEYYVSAVGYPSGRKRLADLADAAGLQAKTLIHPKAWVPKGTVIGDGSVILAGCCISPGVEIGRHAYLSHGSLLGHDCVAEDFVTLMPGASVSGDTNLGLGAMIGANATILQGLTVGNWSVVGAGAVAVKSVPNGATAMGIPARWREKSPEA